MFLSHITSSLGGMTLCKHDVSKIFFVVIILNKLHLMLYIAVLSIK